MKFLTDENISPILVKELRKEKHYVLDIKEKNLRGLADAEIASIALKEKAVIITHDTEFAKKVTLLPSLKILLVTFKERQAKEEKMKFVGWFIANNTKVIFGKKSKIYIKLEAETLKILPI